MDPFEWLAQCMVCGKVHTPQEDDTFIERQWYDPADGHAYQPRALRADVADAYRRGYNSERETTSE